MSPITRTFPILLTAMFVVPLMAQTKPNLTGTWKQQVPKARAAEQRQKPIVFKVEHKEPRFRYTASTETTDAGPFAEFTIDGKEHPGPGPVKVAAHWQGQALVVVYTLNGTKLQTLIASGGHAKMLRDLTLPDREPVHQVYVRE